MYLQRRIQILIFLENALIERVVEFDDNDSEVLMTSNKNNTHFLKMQLKTLSRQEIYSEQSFHLEIVVEEIRAGIGIAQIAGEISNEDIYDVLFSTFCIGK